MKTIIYFILSLLTILYVGILCFMNIYGDVTALGTWGTILTYIELYGGIVIVFLYAFINFFGSPLKAVFFTLLVLVMVIYLLTIFLPSFFRGIFGMNDSAQAAISVAKTWLHF